VRQAAAWVRQSTIPLPMWGIFQWCRL
jgi:hypothetical protein